MMPERSIQTLKAMLATLMISRETYPTPGRKIGTTGALE
jgi:hypothetical protein